MADQKVSALTNDPSPTLDDLLYSVNNPGGSPTSRNVILTDLQHLLFPSGLMMPYAGVTMPTNWLNCDGSAVSRSTYANLFAALCPSLGNPTITIASPAVVTLTAHGLLTGDAVYLTTTGALPTGLSANTIYYAVKIDANTFNLATSRANAYAGTKINTSGTQSGTHTINACPYGLGDGSTTFNIPDTRGRVLAATDQGQNRLNLNNTEGAYGNIGATGGEQSHTLVQTEMPSHTHQQTLGPTIGTVQTGSGKIGGGSNTSNVTNTGGDGAHNNVQPTLVVQHIIKT